jgi:hypothetical protein
MLNRLAQVDPEAGRVMHNFLHAQAREQGKYRNHIVPMDGADLERVSLRIASASYGAGGGRVRHRVPFEAD